VHTQGSESSVHPVILTSCGFVSWSIYRAVSLSILVLKTGHMADRTNVICAAQWSDLEFQ